MPSQVKYNKSSKLPGLLIFLFSYGKLYVYRGNFRLIFFCGPKLRWTFHEFCVVRRLLVLVCTFEKSTFFNGILFRIHALNVKAYFATRFLNIVSPLSKKFRQFIGLSSDRLLVLIELPELSLKTDSISEYESLLSEFLVLSGISGRDARSWNVSLFLLRVVVCAYMWLLIRFLQSNVFFRPFLSSFSYYCCRLRPSLGNRSFVALCKTELQNSGGLSSKLNLINFQSLQEYSYHRYRKLLSNFRDGVKQAATKQRQIKRMVFGRIRQRS